MRRIETRRLAQQEDYLELYLESLRKILKPYKIHSKTLTPSGLVVAL